MGDDLFSRNIKALSLKDPSLGEKILRSKSPSLDSSPHYCFLSSKSGETVPAFTGYDGRSFPLHSLIDPVREAKRLVGDAQEGFLVLLGLGGGFAAKAALEKNELSALLVIEYGLASLAELFSQADYTPLFEDSRFCLLADKRPAEIEECFLNLYQPALYGGLRVLPLRARTVRESKNFGEASGAIERALLRIEADYSVQSYFGKRWFSNIIRNLQKAGEKTEELKPVTRAAITAAGPSLTAQIPLIKKTRKEIFLLSTDTSLPALLEEGIEPDAVISIDCQHWTYYHFLSGIPKNIPLFLDLASPPLIGSLGNNIHFFSGGHPLTRYISQAWRPMLNIDASGANVTYAALSLAHALGAKTIDLYGADFSYPLGVTYAKGSYIPKLFEIRQTRLKSLETQHSAFLLRTPLEKKALGNSWYYETKALSFYRNNIEKLAASLSVQLYPAPGMGAPINIPRHGNGAINLFFKDKGRAPPGIVPRGPAEEKADMFLESYAQKISALAIPKSFTPSFLKSLTDDEKAIFFTLLPIAAAIKKQEKELKDKDLFIKAKDYCLTKINNPAASG
jgi:hypothetical protein